MPTAEGNPFEAEYQAVNLAFASFVSQLGQIKESVVTQWEAFKNQREAMSAKAKQQATLRHNKVKLNVGGTIFSTVESTLLAEKESFFWAMLHSGNWQPDEDGEFFIDRSPHTFGLVLEYLRTGKLITEHLSEFEKQMLASDVDFYGISSFPRLVRFNDLEDDATAMLTDNGTTLVRQRRHPTKEDIYYTAVMPNNGKFRITATKRTVAGWGAAIGIGDASSLKNDSCVRVSFASGRVFSPAKGSYQPFVSWPDTCVRVIDCEVKQGTGEVTFTALGKSYTERLPKEVAMRPVPALLLTYAIDNLSFTLEPIT